MGKTSIKRQLDPKRNVGYIASTIIGWPFSLLENILSDGFIFVKNLVRDKLIAVYSKMADKHLAKLDTTA